MIRDAAALALALDEVTASSATARASHIAAIVALADAVRDGAAREIGELEGEIARLRLPFLDPLFDVAESPLCALGVEDDEPRWTQWLCALLRGRLGAEAGCLARRAFAAAVVEAAEARPDLPDADDIAAAWRRAAGARWDVHDEYGTGGAGFVDLMIMVAAVGLVVVVENKLWEGWHDSEKGKQADRYRRIAEIELKRPRTPMLQRASLILLTARDDVAVGSRSIDIPRDWLCVTWRHVGHHLRHELRLESSTIDKVIHFTGVHLTLKAIEKDLYGHESTSVSGAPLHRLRMARRLVELLREAQ